MFSFSLYSHEIHVSLKETQWERTSPVFPDLAAGRVKEILQSSRLPCLSSVFPRPHTSSQDIVEVKDYKSTPLHTGSLSERHRAHHVIHLQQNRTNPHYLQVHKNKLKPPVLVSFAEAHHEAFPQPEKSGFSPPCSVSLTDLFTVLFQTQHIYRWLLLWNTLSV